MGLEGSSSLKTKTIWQEAFLLDQTRAQLPVATWNVATVPLGTRESTPLFQPQTLPSS